MKIEYFQGNKCYCGKDNLFKDSSYFQLNNCEPCDIKLTAGYCQKSPYKELCYDFSPFTCGDKSGDKFSVHCNPDRQNCTSFQLPATSDKMSESETMVYNYTSAENYVYFGCVKIKDEGQFIIFSNFLFTSSVADNLIITRSLWTYFKIGWYLSTSKEWNIMSC